MTVLLGTVLVASLVGSLHCVGMCGGFVAFYSGSDPAEGVRRLVVHGAYSGGRLVAYVVLGMAAGTVGAALDVAGSLAGVQRAAAWVAGGMMIGWGALALLRIGGVRLFSHRTPRLPVGRWLRAGFERIGQRPPIVRATAVGLLSGLLPCGWLWAFVVTAAGTGHALTGAAVMTAFWAGTVPALVAVGLGTQIVGGRLRRHVPAVTAVLLVVLGVVALVGRPASVDAAISAREAADRAVATDASDVPCCDH